MSEAATDLIINRSSPEELTLSWQGVLDVDDDWLISVNGDMHDTTENEITLSVSPWESGNIEVYPASDTAIGTSVELTQFYDSSSFPIPNVIAVQTRTDETQSYITLTFDRVDSIYEMAPGFFYQVLISETQGDSENQFTTEITTSAFSLPSVFLGGDRWRVEFALPTGSFQIDYDYAITLACAYDGGSGTESDWQVVNQSGNVPADPAMEFSLTTTDHGMVAAWTYPSGPVPLRLEGRINSREWQFIIEIDSPETSIVLSDLIGPAFLYYFSDGATGRTFNARIRPSSSTDSADWITAVDSLPITLSSDFYPHFSFYPKSLQVDYQSLRIDHDLRFIPTTQTELTLTIVDPQAPSGPYSLGLFSSADVFNTGHYIDFLYVLPKSIFGNSWHSRLDLIARNPRNEVVLRVEKTQLLILPTRSSLMPIAPSNIVPTFKKVRDPFSNLQTGCEFTARLAYDAAMLNAAVSIDDGQFAPVTWIELTAFPPTVKFNGITVPRDGLSHIVNLKVWHHDNAVNEDSAELLASSLLATFDMAPPADPTNVTAVLVRNGSGEFPDQVRVSWTSPSPVDIFLIDPDAKKRTLYSADAQEQSVVIENSRKYGTQNGQPHEFRFGVAAFNRSNFSTVIYAPPLSITSGAPPVTPQTEDEIAGTAQKLSQAQLITDLDTQLTAVDAAVIAQVLTATIQKIKDVVRKGGSVTLDNIGQFAAEWTAEKTAFRNGQYVTVPAVRNAAFNASQGLTKGTRAGLVLSDIEAANLV
jgi:nucleoid DNA-binding protein